MTQARRSVRGEQRTLVCAKILRSGRGFSLLEMMIVVSIGVMACVSLIALLPLLRKNHLDQGYDSVLSVLRTYRNLAITQSNRYIIVPSAPGTITVQLWGYSPPPATSPAPVTVATYTLPTDIQFAVQTGFPSSGPDGFGAGTTAIFFNACSVVESGNPCLIFYPDGSSQDDAGNFNGGVLYITQPSTSLLSSRAVDVYGTTGRVRGWRLYYVSGAYTWEQQ